MALHVWSPGDYPVDPGGNHKLYPIEETDEDLSTILYDRHIQRTSQVLANVVGVFNDWILSFFEPTYFKDVRIKTEANFSAFKSLMKNIYKKEKPFIIIDPETVEHDEESIFHQNMINRYNMIDPTSDNFGAKLLYSIGIMKSDRFELVYRRNRFRFDFNILIMEQTMDRQINTYNMLLMNIRHNSKFLLTRTIPHMIPNKYIINIARIHDFDYKSDEFLTFLNSISQYPIIRRITPNNQILFFMEQELNIQVEVPGMPSKDSPETSDAFEWGARITDSFILRADLPTEFLFMLPEQYMVKYDRSIQEEPNQVSVISPIYADREWPDEVNGYTRTNKLDIIVNEDDDNRLNLLVAIRDYNPDIYDTIVEFIQHHRKLSDLVLTKVYPNGSMVEAASTLGDDGILTLDHPQVGKMYTVNVYVNLQTINLIRSGKNKEYIGTIEKY